MLKEWAYAGLLFNYTGAAASHLFARDGAGALIGPIVFTGLAAISWALRPPSRRVRVESRIQDSYGTANALLTRDWR